MKFNLCDKKCKKKRKKEKHGSVRKIDTSAKGIPWAGGAMFIQLS